MQRILSAFWQTLGKRLMILSLISLIGLGGIFVFTAQASYAQIPLNSNKASETPEELTGRPKNAPLSSEEKVERAYTLREGVGIQEEERQKSYEKEAAAAASNPKNPSALYEEDMKAYKESNPEESLPGKAREKAKELVENISK